MRLIDADEFLEYIEKEKALIPIDAEKYHIDEKVVDGMNAAIRAIENEIKEQSTAYNVDKVVEELNEQWNDVSCIDDDMYCIGVANGLAKAIDIVKRGGME